MKTIARTWMLLLAVIAISGCSDDDNGSPIAPAAAGSITIDVEPDGLDAGWVLRGPGGLEQNGTGDAQFKEQEPGGYWISWAPVAGHDSPTSSSQTLDEGSSITFTGAYQVVRFAPPLVGDGESGRDQAIENLQDSYELLNYGRYAELINANFVFVVDQNESGIFGRSELSAVEDLESTYAMFSGETGLTPVLDPVTGLPTGSFEVVPPVKSIRMNLVPSSSGWELTEAGEFGGSWRRTFNLDASVTFSGSGTVNEIRGKQILFLTAASVDLGQGPVEVWQLRGWADQGPSSAIVSRRPVEESSIGRLKIQF